MLETLFSLGAIYIYLFFIPVLVLGLILSIKEKNIPHIIIYKRIK